MLRQNKFLKLFVGFSLLNIVFKIYRYLNLSPDGKLYYQLLNFFLLFLLGIWAYRELFQKDWPKLIKWKNLYLIPLFYVLDFVVAYPAAFLQQVLQEALHLPDGITNTAALSRLTEIIPFPLFMLIIGIMGPIVEELFYRKWLQDRLKQYLPVWGAILLQGILFGIAHGNSFTVAEMLATLPQIIGGIYVGYLYHKTDNIYIPIILHCLNNLLVFY